jgi:hypothetical protein
MRSGPTCSHWDFEIPRSRFSRLSEKEWRVRWNVGGKSRLCPRCGSPMDEVGSLSGWLTPSLFVCDECGYSGYVYVQVDESASEP